MIIACPHCQKKLEVDQQAVGSQVACPGCQNTFTVQGASPPAPSGSPRSRFLPGGHSSGTPGLTRSLAKLGLGLGLILVILSRGCDSLGGRSIERLKAKQEIAKSEFDQSWEAKERKLTKEGRELGREQEKLREEENDAMQGADSRDRQNVMERFSSKRKALDEKRTKLREQAEKLSEQKDKEQESSEEEWAELSNNARNARAENDMWGYWHEWLFVIGTVVLTLGLLGVGLTATGPERAICLILLAVIAISLFFSQAGVTIRR